MASLSKGTPKSNHIYQSGRIYNSPPHSYTKRPTAPVCCTNDSRAHTISCLGVGACLKGNTRALGRGALHKVDSIPLSLTSEKEGLTDNSQLAFPPRFPSYHLVKHAFCILYRPQTPVNHYLYQLPQTETLTGNQLRVRKWWGARAVWGVRKKSGWDVSWTTSELSSSTPTSGRLQPRMKGNGAERQNKARGGTFRGKTDRCRKN